MKRNMSDVDSDCDDVFTDDSPKGTPMHGDDGCHLATRKRRRGIIEKRRRDRINNSLSELRRLVPAAFEKQGSAKLEKAEILQMTVDHLRIIHSKGMDIFSFDPQKFSMDYHGIGFRECASEVARYLVGMEGMDLQDPMRMRLMSHLQCFSAQRDLAVKSAMFNTLPATPTPQYPPIISPLSEHPPAVFHSSGTSYGSSSSETRLSHHSTSSMMSTDTTASSPTTLTHFPRVPLTPTMTPSATTAMAVSMPSTNHHSLANSYSQINTNGNYFSGHGLSGFTSSPAQPAAVRPHRPWGAELAY